MYVPLPAVKYNKNELIMLHSMAMSHLTPKHMTILYSRGIVINITYNAGPNVIDNQHLLGNAGMERSTHIPFPREI